MCGSSPAVQDVTLIVQRALGMLREAMIATRAARNVLPAESPQAAALESAASLGDDMRIRLQAALSPGRTAA